MYESKIGGLPSLASPEGIGCTAIFCERLANLGACWAPIHRCLYFGLSIGLSSRHRWRCIRLSLDLGEHHQWSSARRSLSHSPASLGRISVAPVMQNICWGEPSRREPVMLECLSLYSAECLLPSPRGDTERLPWQTVMATGLSFGGRFILHRHPLMAD